MTNSVLVDSAVKPTPQIAPTPPEALDITVAIPTYNGATRLPMVLDRLRAQIKVDRLNWEVIVCDNNSTDNTAAVVRQYQTSWPSHVPLHYRFAPQQGSAFARQRAVASAKGKLVAFLDDDNIPASDWVASAYQFAQDYPKAGAFGSQIHGQFESELPNELENIKCFLAIIERGESPHRYEPANKILPPAAGLVVRKQAWLATVPEKLFLNNKGKAAGLASEDLEAILHIQKSGWEVWYNPNMIVHHDIPDSRLRTDYLVTLLRCVGLSCFHIRMLSLKQWQRPLAVPAYLAHDIRKLALHRMRYGKKSARMSAVESCNRERLVASVASPFFLLKKAIADSAQAYCDNCHPGHREQLAQLTHAFENSQFSLYEQPVISVVPSAVSPQRHSPAFEQSEVLLRLGGSDRNKVLPSHFFPTAERYGLMRTIDRWVIRHLFARLSHSSERSLLSNSSNHHKYSINLSSDSVKDSGLVQFIAEQLKENRLAASLFCFEIDNRTALTFHRQTRELVQGLRHLGAQVTLDGVKLNRRTTSLLEQLSFDYIKLDLSQSKLPIATDWVGLRDLVQRSSAQAIAKGIESQSILSALQRQGIQYGQGYQLARPKPLG